jgi:hypothetical protein
MDAAVPLLEHGLLSHGAYSLRVPTEPMLCNLDTFDTRDFGSLDLVRSKFFVMKLYERSSSPISEDMLQSLLEKQQPKVEEVSIDAQLEGIQESTKVDGVESDKITMIEDMIILLREKDVNELEKRLHQIEGNPALFAMVKLLLCKAMERFRIEPHLPRQFVISLNAD